MHQEKLRRGPELEYLCKHIAIIKVFSVISQYKRFLLTFNDVSKSRRDEFIESFKKDPEWFEKTNCKDEISNICLRKSVEEKQIKEGLRDCQHKRNTRLAWLLQLLTSKGLDLGIYLPVASRTSLFLSSRWIVEVELKSGIV